MLRLKPKVGVRREKEEVLEVKADAGTNGRRKAKPKEIIVAEGERLI